MLYPMLMRCFQKAKCQSKMCYEEWVHKTTATHSGSTSTASTLGLARFATQPQPAELLGKFAGEEICCERST